MIQKSTAFILSFFTLTAFGAAHKSSRYTQLVVPFHNQRDYSFYYDDRKNAIVLDIQQTSVDEIPAFENYDETLIRRLILSEADSGTTRITMVLRDDDVRVTVVNFQEPFRIIIDLFDKDYKDSRDPETSFPLESSLSSIETSSRAPTNIYGAGISNTQSPRSGINPYQSSGSRQKLSYKPKVTNINTSDNQKTKRKLLQAPAQSFGDPNKLINSLKKIPPGRGLAWQKFPKYIYRIQLASYKTGKSYKDFINKNTAKAMSSMSAMADYAGKLFDFGHEGRALVAYKQVIHKAPLIFDKSPLHLWRVAEINLGQGNLTLADNYYESMLDKHPDHPLAAYAMMRRIDIKVIQAIRDGKSDTLNAVKQELTKVPDYKDIEFQAQKALRHTYWNQSEDFHNMAMRNKNILPPLRKESKKLLMRSYKNAEVPWTAFLMATLLLNDSLNINSPWSKEQAQMAEHYFKNYKGKKLEPFRSNMMSKMTHKLNKVIANHMNQKDYLSVIEVYESLSNDLQKFTKTPQSTWALAESYRLLSQPEKAIPFYKKSIKLFTSGKERFRSYYWLMVSSSQALNPHRSTATATEKSLRSQVQSADKNALKSWQDLKNEEQKDLLISFKASANSLIASPYLLQTPAKMLLQGWQASLNSDVENSLSNTKELKAAYSPKVDTVDEIVALANKFSEIGLKKKREECLLLLSKLDEKSISPKKDTEILWANNLKEFAEIYRKSNRNLDAGRIYALMGSNSKNWEGRAESLYKGGLLLYRSGRREEAIEAFTKASQDGNNLLYADLAKKRLDIINR